MINKADFVSLKNNRVACQMYQQLLFVLFIVYHDEHVKKKSQVA